MKTNQNGERPAWNEREMVTVKLNVKNMAPDIPSFEWYGKQFFKYIFLFL